MAFPQANVRIGLDSSEWVRGTKQIKQSNMEVATSATQTYNRMGEVVKTTTQQVDAAGNAIKRTAVDVKGLSLSMIGLGTTVVGVVTSLSNLDRAAARVEKSQIAVRRIEDQIASTRAQLNNLTQRGQQGTERYIVAQGRLETALADLEVKQQDVKLAQDALNDTQILFATTVINTSINSLFLLKSALAGTTLSNKLYNASMITTITTNKIGAVSFTTVGKAALFSAAGIKAATAASRAFVASPVGIALTAIAGGFLILETNVLGARDALSGLVGFEVPSLFNELNKLLGVTSDYNEQVGLGTDEQEAFAAAVDKGNKALSQRLSITQKLQIQFLRQQLASARSPSAQLAIANQIAMTAGGGGGLLARPSSGGGGSALGTSKGIGVGGGIATGSGGVAGGGIVSRGPSGGVVVSPSPSGGGGTDERALALQQINSQIVALQQPRFLQQFTGFRGLEQIPGAQLQFSPLDANRRLIEASLGLQFGPELFRQPINAATGIALSRNARAAQRPGEPFGLGSAADPTAVAAGLTPFFPRGRLLTDEDRNRLRTIDILSRRGAVAGFDFGTNTGIGGAGFTAGRGMQSLSSVGAQMLVQGFNAGVIESVGAALAKGMSIDAGLMLVGGFNGSTLPFLQDPTRLRARRGTTPQVRADLAALSGVFGGLGQGQLAQLFKRDNPQISSSAAVANPDFATGGGGNGNVSAAATSRYRSDLRNNFSRGFFFASVFGFTSRSQARGFITPNFLRGRNGQILAPNFETFNRLAAQARPLAAAGFLSRADLTGKTLDEIRVEIANAQAQFDARQAFLRKIDDLEDEARRFFIEREEIASIA